MNTHAKKSSSQRAAPDVAQLARDFLKADRRWWADPKPMTLALMKCRKLVLEQRVLKMPTSSAD